MRPLWKPVAACLAGLALAAPAAAGEKDRHKEFIKQQREHEKRLWEQQKKKERFRERGAFVGFPSASYPMTLGQLGFVTSQHGLPLGAGGYPGIAPGYSPTRPVYPQGVGHGPSPTFSGPLEFSGPLHVPPARSTIPAPVDGVWYFRGDPSKPCSVQTVAGPSGTYLVFTNENGTPAAGWLSGDGCQVTIPDWNLTGTVRGEALVWPNGDFWGR
jgi:hypothetical protein